MRYPHTPKIEIPIRSVRNNIRVLTNMMTRQTMWSSLFCLIQAAVRSHFTFEGIPNLYHVIYAKYYIVHKSCNLAQDVDKSCRCTYIFEGTRYLCVHRRGLGLVVNLISEKFTCRNQVTWYSENTKEADEE